MEKVVKIPLSSYFNKGFDDGSIAYIGCPQKNCDMCNRGYKYFEYGKHCIMYVSAIKKFIDSNLKIDYVFENLNDKI